MSPRQKSAAAKLLPWIGIIGAGVAAWVTINSRVSALEARQDERKDDISEIRDSVKRIDQRVEKIVDYLMPPKR